MAEAVSEVSPTRTVEAGIYTETLARLYLKQGFVTQALAIYRRVAQEQPENQTLQARLQRLEQDIALGLLNQEPAGQEVKIPSPVAPRVVAPRPVHTQVIAQLERWLHYLQTQSLAPTPPSAAYQAEG